MSRPKGFPLQVAVKKVKTQAESNLVNKTAQYLSNMEVFKIGTFSVQNIYDITDTKPLILPNGDVRRGPVVRFEIVRITDLNDRTETGRSVNNSKAAREVLGGATISYAVVPLEEIDKNGRANFFNIPLANSTEIFDPRLVALSTYPRDISDIAQVEKASQGRLFQNSVKTINTDNEFIPFNPTNYYTGVLNAVLDANPQLLDNSCDITQ